MRTAIAVLASICLCAIPVASLSQKVNGVANQRPAMARSGAAKRAEAEWNRLHPRERTCVNQKLIERGDSLKLLTRRAILPSDSRVADLRAYCRQSAAPATIPQTNTVLVRDQTATVPTPPSAPVQQSPSQFDQVQSGALLDQLTQTVSSLKIELENSAGKIAILERRNNELEQEITQSERMRWDAQVAKEAEMREAQQKEKWKTDALIAQLEADKSNAVTSAHVWAIVAYIAIGILFFLLVSYAFIVLTGRERSSPEIAY